MSVRKEDVFDPDFADANELSSDGTLVFKAGVTVVSTTAATKTITISSFDLVNERDTPVNSGDLVTLSGNAAAGTYTVNSILSSTSFDVIESIVDSTGGAADFKYDAGAKRVGISTASAKGVTTKTVQGFVDGHRNLRELIHLAEEGGPFEGFASGAFQEILPSGDPFPTSFIWWTSSSKTSKIVEETIVYNANRTINTDQWKVYDIDGSTILATVTDIFTYNGVFIVSITRTIA